MANFRKSFNFRNGVQVDDDNFVVSSNGAVGIGTTVPTGYILDVRGNASVTGLVTSAQIYSGVGTVTNLTSTNVNVGVLTVTQLKVGSSPIVGNLVGYAYTGWVTDDPVGLTTTARVGIGTTAIPSEQLKVQGNARVVGVLTATTFSGALNASNLTGTIDNARLPSAISVTSIAATTITGTASAAASLTGTPSISVNVVTATKVVADSIEVPNTGVTTVTKLLHVGTGGTIFSAIEDGRVGVGTALPTSEFQVRKSSGTLAEVVSDSGQARISVGNSVGAGNSSATLRFGNSTGVLDVINNDVGDVKTIIHAGTGAGSTGNFKWIYGQTSAERMTLTYDGKLGLNQTSPTRTLHVVGTSTVTGNAWVGGNLSVAGNITGTLSFPSIITGTNLSNISGITTLNDLKVSNSIDFSTISVVALGNTVAVGTDAAAPDPSDGIPFGLTVNNKLKANKITVQDGIDMSAGIMTASNVRSTFGFRSGVGTEFIQIDYASSPNRIIFTVAGIGSTSLNLY
jgi:hypothetical protein